VVIFILIQIENLVRKLTRFYWKHFQVRHNH